MEFSPIAEGGIALVWREVEAWLEAFSIRKELPKNNLMIIPEY